MTLVLDEQAREVLRTLRPGDQFTLKDRAGTLQCMAWEHPVESEPWVRAYGVDPRTGALNGFCAIRVSRIDKVLPMRAA